MRFRKIARVEAGMGQIDIAPLVDCVFNLLVFFMLTSSFVMMPGINVKLPKAITSDEIDKQSLTVVITSEDLIYIDEKPKTMQEVETVLKQKKFESIFIKADRDATLGTAVRIWDICKQLGIEKVGIATTYDE